MSTKKCYQTGWDAFKKIVNYDLTSNFLTTGLLLYDVYTDIEAGREHWNNNDILWAIATWVLMFVPAMLSLAIEVTLERSKESLIKVMGHLPLFQSFYHIYIIRQLKAKGDEIRDHEKFYTDLDFDDLPDGIQTELRTRCNKRREAKLQYTKLLANLQTQKLFEGFGESAPEAVLQIYIVLVKGRCSKTVLMSIITSFISLSKCAMGTYLTMPTKGKDVKEASWKTKLFFVLPSMIMIATPRILSLSILTSYLKEWIFLTIFLMVAINCLANCRFVWRDPAKAIFACLINIFCPVIIVEEGSTFFLKSALIGNLMHASSLILLAVTVVSGVLNPYPCNNSQPSILHCFTYGNPYNYTVMRCPLTGNIFFLLLLKESLQHSGLSNSCRPMIIYKFVFFPRLLSNLIQ